MHARVQPLEASSRHEPSVATTRAPPGSNVRRRPATSGPTPSRYAPKCPTAPRRGHGARSSVSGTSSPASVRRNRCRRSMLASPVQRIAHAAGDAEDRKSTRLNSSHLVISYAVFCLKKKKKKNIRDGYRYVKIDNYIR